MMRAERHCIGPILEETVNEKNYCCRTVLIRLPGCGRRRWSQDGLIRLSLSINDDEDPFHQTIYGLYET